MRRSPRSTSARRCSATACHTPSRWWWTTSPSSKPRAKSPRSITPRRATDRWRGAGAARRRHALRQPLRRRRCCTQRIGAVVVGLPARDGAVDRGHARPDRRDVGGSARLERPVAPEAPSSPPQRSPASGPRWRYRVSRALRAGAGWINSMYDAAPPLFHPNVGARCRFQHRQASGAGHARRHLPAIAAY